MEDEGINVLFLDVGNRSFAVEMGQVETIRRKETVLPAREGPPDLLGFLLLGRAIVPILDLGFRLCGHMSTERSGLLIVAAAEVVSLAFRVRQVGGPLLLPWDQVTLLPELLRDLQERPAVWGLIWRDETLVPLLDLRQVVPAGEVAALLELAQRAAST
jgi:chemotaxis signal transduction protein